MDRRGVANDDDDVRQMAVIVGKGLSGTPSGLGNLILAKTPVREVPPVDLRGLLLVIVLHFYSP